jgi:hypothetical protein
MRLKAALFRPAALVGCVTIAGVLGAAPPGSCAPKLSEPVLAFAKLFLSGEAALHCGGCPMSLGCERSGVYLDLVDALPVPDLPPERTVRIRLTQDGSPKTDTRGTWSTRTFAVGRSAFLTDLKQLRGLVRITDEQAALRFARLRTSPYTWYAWGQERYEVEIVSETQALSLPDFGLGRWGLAYRPKWSGQLGILYDPDYHVARSQLPKGKRIDNGLEVERWSFWTARQGAGMDQDYRTAGFEPAKVERVPGGFEVTRWIFWTCSHGGTASPPKRGIQRLREFVGEDGEYRRTTVGKTPLKRAPGLEIPLSIRESRPLYTYPD